MRGFPSHCSLSNHTQVWKYSGIIVFLFLYKLNLRILEAKQSCELNPSKIESPTEACANAEFLLQVCDWPTEPLPSLLSILIEICMEEKANNCPAKNSYILNIPMEEFDDITESIFSGVGRYHRIDIHVERGLSPHITIHLRLLAEGCAEQVREY